MARDEVDAAPSTCSACGTEGKVVFVVYGEATPAIEERARAGEVVLGGWSGWEGSPRWECLVCGAGFGRRAPFARPAVALRRRAS